MQIGFNVRDGYTAFVFFSEALSDKTQSIDEYSNVGEPGVFFYRIDGRSSFSLHLSQTLSPSLSLSLSLSVPLSLTLSSLSFSLSLYPFSIHDGCMHYQLNIPTITMYFMPVWSHTGTCIYILILIHSSVRSHSICLPFPPIIIIVVYSIAPPGQPQMRWYSTLVYNNTT